MISLADLRARNVTPIWQEAVAVVQELIQTVKATTGSAELLPDLEHVALIPNGDVVALPGSPEPAAPVRHAAVMLKLLVEGIAVPPELEQFVFRNVSDPPQYDTVAEFSRNLAFFERPGRRSDVERLVARALTAEQTSRAEEELQRLKERASEVTHVMAPPEFLQQPKKAQTIPIAVVAAVGVAVIAAGLWLWQRASAPRSPASAAAGAAATAGKPTAASGTADSPSAAATAGKPAEAGGTAPASPPAPSTTTGQPVPQPTATAAPPPPAPAAHGQRTVLQRAGDAVRTAVGTLVGSTPAPAPAPAAASTPKPSTDAKTASAPRPRPRRTSKPAAVAAASPTPAPAAATPSAPVVIAAAAFEPAPASAKVEPAVEESIEVFTASDSTVTPPVIMRPVLPKELPPGVPANQVGTIEIVVDEQGDVLHVKLVSPANRYHERMLVSAAKMWKFRPAYKDGRPVRYKTRVRLTV
jgi:hypothetical protein